MIRVTVELDKYGLCTDFVKLATVEIANDGTGDADVGNYVVRAFDKHGEPVGHGAVKGFMRRRRSALYLLGKGLQIMGYTS
jgi:hypothetical protein